MCRMVPLSVLTLHTLAGKPHSVSQRVTLSHVFRIEQPRYWQKNNDDAIKSPGP